MMIVQSKNKNAKRREEKKLIEIKMSKNQKNISTRIKELKAKDEDNSTKLKLKTK